jgi:2-oxoglutarate ferredoxin oxidoreductase subunit delta
MSVMKAPENTPVWVDEKRCKACDLCVSVCPAGVLAMRLEPTSTLGAMLDIIAPQDCIGCKDCELHCPDFAIYVAEKDELKDGFAKLSDKSKERAAAIKANSYRLPAQYK